MEEITVIKYFLWNFSGKKLNSDKKVMVKAMNKFTSSVKELVKPLELLESCNTKNKQLCLMRLTGV